MKQHRIMVQGTASSVGKSILAAALCRIFSRDGYKVHPFKAQNMSLNSYCTPDGFEISRAQAMQAEAAGVAPSVRMNPILLKPTSDRKSQVVWNGRVYGNMDAAEYFAFKPRLKKEIARTYRALEAESDIVVIEGAGSPAEINLNRDDFVNMGMAEIADAPVILVGDIDKGGVFAAIVGTLALLDETERSRIKGVVINKFRGSYELLQPGLATLEELVKVPVLGVIPYFELHLDEEDSAFDWSQYHARRDGADLDVAVIRFPYMANFTDVEPLRLYEDIQVRFITKPREFGTPDLVILPGSKSTIQDMEWLQTSGLAKRIVEHSRMGGFMMGICGGYQCLGREIADPHQVEGETAHIEGLKLLEVFTKIQAGKITTICEGTDQVFHSRIRGYEIHMGETRRERELDAFATIRQRNGEIVTQADGAISRDRRIWGTYIHSVFDNAGFTRAFLNMIRRAKGMGDIATAPPDYWEYKDHQYDELAKIFREHLDLKQIYTMMGESRS